MSDVKFCDGLIVKRNENAPDWALCKLSIKKDEFIQFLNEQDGDWVNVECCVGKSGKPYAKLDDWKPESSQDGNKEETVTNETDLPF